jgi:hypothetical protein
MEENKNLEQFVQGQEENDNKDRSDEAQGMGHHIPGLFTSRKRTHNITHVTRKANNRERQWKRSTRVKFWRSSKKIQKKEKKGTPPLLSMLCI